MQTVKTAAIVVLLLTVLYGAYVSITTPPQPIPPEVAELIKIDDDFNIDSGLAESMTLTDLDPGAPGTTALGAVSMQVEPPPEANSFGASFTDLAPGPIPGASPVIQTPAAGLPPTQPNPLNKLPPTTGTASVRAIAGQAYPSTGNTINIPDPDSVSFNATTGNKFNPSGDAQTNLTSLAPPTAVDQIAAPGANDTLSKAELAANTVSQASATKPTGDRGLTNALITADNQYSKDRLKEALATLSLFYNAPNATEAQRTELLGRLDPLARQVIYSKRHLLEQPYRVARGETLQEIGKKFDVPWQLLANINGVTDPVAILPGTELKVVKGPFSAQVDLKRKELTLFAGDLYAGRFPIEVGNEPVPKPGTFTVQDKQVDRTFYGATGAPIEAGNPNNPYGDVWLDLGGQLCIHGSPYPTRPTDRGCISLPGDSASDLYGILSQGSSVTIRR